MALDYSAISTSLEDIKNRALNLNTGLGQFQNQSIPGSDQTIPDLGRKLTGVFSQFNPAEEEKTIMEKFAGRRTLAEEGAEAQKKLITSQAETGIEEAKTLGEKEVTAERESRRGFATNTALVRDIEDRGAKRVRDIEKARDELLLKGDMAKAERLDNLLVQEQTLVTLSRQNWIRNLFRFTSAITGLAGFETPAAKGQRELQTEIQKSIINLAAKAPDAGITQSDDLQTALQKYRQSSVYKNDIVKSELEIDKSRAEIRKSDAERAKILAQISNPDMTPSQVSSFNAIVNRYSSSPLIAAADRTMTTANLLPNIKANPGDRENQLTAIYQFIQILDNYQSAVREGEIALLTGTSALTERIETTFTKLKQGLAVHPDVILDVVNGMESLINSINDAARQKEAMFASQANVVGLGDEWIKFRRGFQASYDVSLGQGQQRNLGPITLSPEGVGENLSDNLFGDVLTNIFNQP